ncbi:zinc finger protein 106 isoform 2-T4 [Odontesthes bonariensis]|uniref:zinc finger protein 106 isoform X2 n=1 Tax=Odontesthes bonariensis TaxID=219752 RepID=UPI003F582ECB
MADVQRPRKKALETPVKKKPPRKLSPQPDKKHYCILCRTYYLKHEAQDHVHSMLHHKELEKLLGKDASHDCQACKEKSLGLNEYSEHISTSQHKAKLRSLMTKHRKPLALCKTLSTASISKIKERNKALKREERKAMKKKRKKQKQQAGRKRVEMQQGAIKTKTVASKGVIPAKSKQVQAMTSKQKQQAQCERSNSVVVQNKENNSLRSDHHGEFTQQNQSERPIYQPGGPVDQHHHYAHYQFPQSAPHHMRYDGGYPGNDMYSAYNYQAAYMPAQVPYPVRHPYYYNSQYNHAADREFTSDQLPQNGALASDFHQCVNTGSSQPESSNCSAQTDSAHKSVSTSPIRDVDVSAMLKQIRRTLGVREPCRADREARKQNGEAGARAADHSTPQQAEAELPAGSTPRSRSTSTQAVPAPQVKTSAPSAHADVCPSVKPKPTTLKKTQEISKSSEKSSVAVERQTNSQLSAEGSTSLTGKAASSEPKLSNARKVRIAHKTCTTQGKKEAVSKATLDGLHRLSGARSKLSWKEMYDGMKSVKKKDIRGPPRFGIELENRQTDHENSAPNSDLPLSEGFHWESIPESPAGSQSTLPPPPRDGQTETRADSQTPTSLEQPDAAPAPCSSGTEARVSVKVEPNLEDGIGDLRANISASKRKHSVVTDDGLSDKSTSKKKKTKPSQDQNQMDQLLAVSLREDELSRSLQDLDKSLVQARNALQAAYADVQRILLLRQQFTAEVNTLRAKRIEILQGMQGYAGASNGAGRATNSSSGPTSTAPSLPSSSAFSTSLSQQPCARTSSVTTPHPTPLPLPVVSLKQEISHSATTGQASLFSKSCNSDTLQVPLNQPVPLFSPDLLPRLLLGPSHLAAPTAAASAKQPTAESSTSVNRTSPDLSARQQEQETIEGVIGRVKSEMLVKKAQKVEGSSVEETAGNLSKGQVKGKEPAADKSVPERGQKASDVYDKGNESDDSVEMVSASNMEVIDIDESESEDSPEATSPAQPETPQRSVSVEFSAAGTQTAQQSETERKFQPPAMPAKDAGSVEEDEPSLGAFSSHTGPVHGLQVHGGVLYTCSGDNTARAYSLVSRECQAVFEGHTNKVNCLLVSSRPNMPIRLYTGSSDQTIRSYSIKSKKCLEQISLPDRVLCLHIAWNILYAGLASGAVASYDLKTLKELDIFECHGPRGVSCLGTAQEGARRLLLVGSYDSTISVRDAKSGLLLRSLEGHTKTVLCMKVVNDLVFSGSSDTSVHAHNIHTGELVRIYKGHGHAVTSIVILGKVMVTACLDELVRVYELQSHDRLQVYGGHSDMVMCMAVHKSVIYTGCYDGSVQAVKLNLMKNHRCWWQSCSLIFGMAEHLLQHLLGDHSSPNLQTVKCRWRGCNTFFSTQQSVRQELPEHMQSHVVNDSKLQP